MGTRRNYQRTSNKNDSPLHVLPVAERLIDYTLDLTDNAKRFPKRVRFSITNKIQGHVMAIYDDLLEANEIFPIRTEADRTERLRLQRTALTECKKLLHMIELSKKRTYIDKDTFDYWTKLKREQCAQCQHGRQSEQQQRVQWQQWRSAGFGGKRDRVRRRT